MKPSSIWRAAPVWFAVLASAGAQMETPWQAGLSFDYAEASKQLEGERTARPDDPRVAVAYAASLLVKQPLTAGNVEKAHTILIGIATRENTGDMAVLALYLAARVEQDHLSPARVNEARAHYRELLERHPAHVLAGQSAVQLGLLAAWGEPQAEPGAVVHEIETLLASVRQPEAKGELHYILGRFHFETRKDVNAALEQLEAGRTLAYLKPFRNAEIDLMIGNMARDLGRRELAARHYEAFLQANSRDSRASTVRRYLRELRADGATGESGLKP